MKNKRTNFKISKKQLHKRVLFSIVYDYYEKHNLVFSVKDTETIQRYRVYRAFDNIFFERDVEFDMNEAVKELKVVLPEMKKLLKQCNDGSKPYGTENDYGNLCYVADRWMSEGRLSWLIKLAERNWEYKKVPEKEYPEQITWVQK